MVTATSPVPLAVSSNVTASLLLNLTIAAVTVFKKLAVVFTSHAPLPVPSPRQTRFSPAPLTDSLIKPPELVSVNVAPDAPPLAGGTIVNLVSGSPLSDPAV